MDSIFYGEGFSPLAMKNVSIKHLQLFEDRSDVACRVVIKTGVSVGGMVYVYCDGRGNLRENREDPAPTVGRLRGFHCDPHRAQRPPIAAAMRVPCHPACPPMSPWF